MFTNTFTPHVGGVTRRDQQFVAEYRRRGRRVLAVAPKFSGSPIGEEDVVRIPAVQRFNGTDFSVPVPIPGYLHTTLDESHPHVVHSHRPLLVAGSGPSEATIRQSFHAASLDGRFILLGALDRDELASVYDAMDVFAFASQSETQGMVLTGAMAAGTPVVAVDGPGVRGVVRDETNGRLLMEKNESAFVEALDAIFRVGFLPQERQCHRMHSNKGNELLRRSFFTV